MQNPIIARRRRYAPNNALRIAQIALPLLMAIHSSAAMAELPEPVRAMIATAIKRGDAKTVRTVIDIARETNPEDVEELDALLAKFENSLSRQTAQAAAAKQEEIRSAGLFDNWTGKGEIGAFHSTGNSSNTGLTTGLSLNRDGIDWRHKLRAAADFQRSRGRTTRERFLAAYEPNYRISRRQFFYGLAQFERDRFQGFSARYSFSGGVGYDLVERSGLTLSIKGGPAWRRTELINAPSESAYAALAGLDLNWKITGNIKLVEEASAYLQRDNSSFVSNTGIQAGIANDLSVRLSYNVEHETNPPAGRAKTDTHSRVTLIYDF